MSVNTRYLRGSDILKDLDNKNKYYDQNPFLIISTPVLGGLVADFLANKFIEQLIVPNLNTYTSYFVERVVEVIPNATPFIIGGCGAMGFFFYKDFKTFSKVKDAKSWIANPNEIIDQVKYENISIIMGSDLSIDLNTYQIPEHNEIESIVEKEQEILDGMLNQISNKECDHPVLYNSILEKLHTEKPIIDFLCENICNENVCEIFLFAKANKLHTLQYHCDSYYKAHAIEILATRKHL